MRRLTTSDQALTLTGRRGGDAGLTVWRVVFTGDNENGLAEALPRLQKRCGDRVYSAKPISYMTETGEREARTELTERIFRLCGSEEGESGLGVVRVMEEFLLVGGDGGCDDVGAGEIREAHAVGDGGDGACEAG